jgi:hypothetical protein
MSICCAFVRGYKQDIVLLFQNKFKNKISPEDNSMMSGFFDKTLKLMSPLAESKCAL